MGGRSFAYPRKPARPQQDFTVTMCARLTADAKVMMRIKATARVAFAAVKSNISRRYVLLCTGTILRREGDFFSMHT